MNGFFVINKPKGMTSSAVVVKARQILGQKKIGHMGTLDPDATGVLPLAVGRATRLFDHLLDKKKGYHAGFVFGEETDTLDASGVVTKRMEANFSLGDLTDAARQLTGEIEQMPPAYSAKSVGGVRSYTLARKGIEPNLTPKKITVYSFDFAKKEGDTYFFDIVCSSGTYIRSLARDIARLLGTVGYMQSLQRRMSGVFTLEQALTLEELSSEKIIPMEKVLSDLPRFDVPETYYKQLADGVKCGFENLPQGTFSVFCRGELFGIGEKDQKGRLKLRSYLREKDEKNQIF